MKPGRVRGCKWGEMHPTTNLGTRVRNLRNIKDKHADLTSKNVPHIAASTSGLCFEKPSVKATDF